MPPIAKLRMVRQSVSQTSAVEKHAGRLGNWSFGPSRPRGYDGGGFSGRQIGVPESVVMARGGWKTASMFRRYAIVSAADQKQTVELLEIARARDRERAEAERPLGSAPHFGE
jgi:hypothetical protein